MFTTLISNTVSSTAAAGAADLGVSRKIALTAFTTTHILAQAVGGLVLPRSQRRSAVELCIAGRHGFHNRMRLDCYKPYTACRGCRSHHMFIHECAVEHCHHIKLQEHVRFACEDLDLSCLDRICRRSSRHWSFGCYVHQHFVAGMVGLTPYLR
jgi:hypothetical protein